MAEAVDYNQVIRQLLGLTAKLDKFISGEGISNEENDMPKRRSDKVTVEGRERWIHGYSVQELYDDYVRLLVQEGLIEWVDRDETTPYFGDYLKTFYNTFKQKQQSNTVVNRNRIIRNHILPAFGKKRIDRIRVTDIQKWFNTLAKKYSRETILKIKNIMSPVFDAALEDDMITKNPLASKHIEIPGRETVHHKAIPKEKMAEIRLGLTDISGNERFMAALLCYTGMRFEEVLGLRWEDVDGEYIRIQRAVVHPTRNQAEIKLPKTKTSLRAIPLHPELKKLFEQEPHANTGFILHSKNAESPLTYTEARRIFDKIRDRFSIHEYTAHDFRDTCATEWRENDMPLDMIARLLGHSKTETTEKRYVKYRTDMMEKAKEKMG